MQRRVRLGAVLMSAVFIIGSLTATGARASAATFHASGSVGQVYVTGLAANE